MKHFRKIVSSVKYLLLVPAMLAVLFASCTPENQLAKEYIRKQPLPAILLLVPDQVIKKNLKTFEVPGYDSLNDDARDSALFFGSRYIRELSDSVFLERFVNAMIDELEKLGFKVYLQEEVDTFLQIPGQAFIFNIAQMEADESVYPVHSEEVFEDSGTYSKDIALNSFELSSWYELSGVNMTGTRKVLYASDNMTDYLEGRWTRNLLTGEVKFKYRIEPIGMEDIYDFAGLLGQKYAGYLYDYLMNRYIRGQMPGGAQPRYYYHRSRLSPYLRPVGEEKFIEMEEK